MRLVNSSRLIYLKLLIEGLPVIEISHVARIYALLSVSDMNNLVVLFMQESCLSNKPSPALGSVLWACFRKE